MAEKGDSHSRRGGPFRAGGSWLMRIALGLVLFVVLIVVGHGWWGRHANSQLAALMAEYKAAGEPVVAADLVGPASPDEQNAVIELRAAAAAIDTKGEAWDAFQHLEPAVPLNDEELAAIRRILEQGGADALAKVRLATTKSGVDWRLQFASPILATALKDLSEQRNLARLLGGAALYTHHLGDDAEAVRLIREALFVSRAIDRQPFLISHLVAIACAGSATERLAQIAPELRIASGPAGGSRAGAGPASRSDAGLDGSAASGSVSRSFPGTGPVPTATSRPAGWVASGNPPTPAGVNDVKALLAELLDSAGPIAAHQQGLRGERVMQLDAAAAVIDGKLDLSQLASGGGGRENAGILQLSGMVIKPIVLSDARLMAEYMAGAIDAAAAPDLPTSRAQMPPSLDREIGDYRLLHPFAATMLPSLTRAQETNYRSLTDRRLAATALAARWYAVDHGGAMPKQLSDLVSAYLPAVPLDAMTAGKPLQFVASGTNPIVYSIGSNGTDEAGSETPINMSTPNPGAWGLEDRVVHLTAQPRPAPEQQARGPHTRPTTWPGRP